MRILNCDTYQGRQIKLYELNDGIVEVGIYDIGARINYIKVGGVDITLGFNDMPAYLASGSFAGGTIGRVGNRIARGKFCLNGKSFKVNCNEGNNHLHGGNVGFDNRFFDVAEYSDKKLVLTLVSPDGEEGYPGNLNLTVTYALENNTLLIEYKAVSDKDTLFNPTNHTYFNLDGESSMDCRDNVVQIFADKYTLVDSELIPTGKSAEVCGTAFDFREPKTIRRDFDDDKLNATNGYDHNFELNGTHAVHVKSTKTGIEMDVYTDMPCLQLYTGGALKPCVGKTHNYSQWAGFCLEPQYCPNAINMSGYEQPILNKGDIQKHYIKYEFKS